MKKILSVLVALAMVVALAAPALASNTAPNHSSGGLGVQRIDNVSITGNGNSARINVEAYGLDIQFPNRPANNQTNTFISDEGVKVTVFVRGNAILQGSATVECLCWNSTRSEIAPTCTTAGSYEYRCDVCDEVTASGIIAAVGHIWDEWNVVREACCQHEGEKYRLCQWSETYGCIQEDTIPKLDCDCDDEYVPYVPSIVGVAGIEATAGYEWHQNHGWRVDNTGVIVTITLEMSDGTTATISSTSGRIAWNDQNSDSNMTVSGTVAGERVSFGVEIQKSGLNETGFVTGVDFR